MSKVGHKLLVSGSSSTLSCFGLDPVGMSVAVRALMQSIQPNEMVLLEQSDVLITASRIVVEGATYLVSGVRNVTVSSHRVPRGWAIAAVVMTLLALGLRVSLGGLVSA